MEIVLGQTVPMFQLSLQDCEAGVGEVSEAVMAASPPVTRLS